ncbi:MAG: glycerophosphodiester phosphodiesterase family protein [Ardenticatenaceae bacterium]|nr:glycerophosphodiester phosphodiesterase family protein [Ardenticatenaceae bacterium]
MREKESREPSADRMVARPHPESVIRTTGGRIVDLKVHRCLWSGTYPENSLPAIEECYREAVARVEIDVCMLRDADFLVIHDLERGDSTNGSGPVGDRTRREAQSLRILWDDRLSTERPPLFSEMAGLIREQASPTLMELDLQEVRPIPWPRVEELVRLVEPVKERVVFNSQADWNLRRLLHVDSTLPMGFDPAAYLDWVPEGWESESAGLPRGAYNYLDAHWLAAARLTPVADYLADRLGGILRLVPGAREVHFRLAAFERILDDGVANAADLFHRHGMLLDVWTLDAGTPRWRERLARALTARVDVVTTNTPRALSAAAREDLSHHPASEA